MVGLTPSVSPPNEPADQSQSQLQLPAIGPVHSTPSKKSTMKKRLSRMAFSFGANEDQQNNSQSQFNYDLDSSSFSVDNTMIDSSEEPSVLPVLNDKYSSTNSLTLNSSSNAIPTVETNGSTHNLHKFNRSTSSLANSVTSSLHKLPYKSSNTNSSSVSVSNQFPSQSVPNLARSNSASNAGGGNVNNVNSGTSKSVNFSYNITVSPNKGNARYLATNNDHTFMLSRQPHSALVPPQAPNQRQSHSQSSSINNISDEAPIPITNTNSNNTTSGPRVISPTSLPQFVSVNSQNNPLNTSNNTVLAPPTVLTPVYKTHSSSTQGTSQFYGTANNSSIMYMNHNNTQTGLPPPSISDTVSTTTTSNTRQQKKGTGLLQNAYRSSHQTKDKNCASSNNNSSNVTNTNNSSNEITADNGHDQFLDMICLDSKHHFISPKISNQFKSLQHLIQLGVKKRMEYLDSENTSLLNDINNYYDELDNLFNQLATQVADLDSYITTLQSKKKNDIKTLQQHGLFENLNDLTNRIDNVKKNMDSKKDILKMFDVKLNSLSKLKDSFEKRNRNRKHMVSIMFTVIFLLFLLKVFICRFF